MINELAPGCGRRERINTRTDSVCVKHIGNTCKTTALVATDVPGHLEHTIAFRDQTQMHILDECTCGAHFKRTKLLPDEEHGDHPILSIRPTQTGFDVSCCCGCKYKVERLP